MLSTSGPAGESISGSPRFEYDPLPGPSYIRLLRRLDPADDGTLRFSLTSHDIDSAPAYHCLSYTWGNPFAHGPEFRGHFDAIDPQYGEKNKACVLVNGQVTLIQKNLYDALRMIPRTSYLDYVNRPLDGTNGRVYLHIAAAAGRETGVKTWLRFTDINKLDEEGHNALHYAAANGRPECISLLLRRGCQRDARDKDGKTPVDLAREQGHNHVAALLEESSPQPDADERDTHCTASQGYPASLIWADAICIDQNNLDEKSSQVSMMDRIYSTASYVAAWLGPPDERSDVGIQTANTLHRRLEAYKESQIEPFSGKDKQKYAEAGVPYISRAEWGALASLYQRQWFRRAWIVQEAVLPDALLMYIGGTFMSSRLLGNVSEAIGHMEGRLGTSLSSSFAPEQDVAVSVTSNMEVVSRWRKNMVYSRDGHKTPDEHRALFIPRHVVYDFWTFLSSDPRDQVFAYYGLLNLFATERRQANYQSSLADIYTAATRELISSQGNLHALSACVYPQQRRSGLPSWVPDFSLQGINAMPSGFSPDKGLEYIPPSAADPTCPVLRVRASYLGQVSKVDGHLEPKLSGKLLIDSSWLTLVLSLRGKGGYGENPCLSSILWETLCMERSGSSMVDKAPPKQGIDFHFFMILLVLAAGDAKIREKRGDEITTKNGLICSGLDYDPMVEDMEPVLADLDAFGEDEGDGCWLPSREKVLRYWNDFEHGLLRNIEAELDERDGPIDFYLPEGATQENSRPVGSGYMSGHSLLARRWKCGGFVSAYSNAYGGRQLITVGDRLLGMASISAKPGDELWLIPGMNALAVLRRVAQTGLVRFEFVGSCYMYGMMHGEVADRAKSGLVYIELV